MKVKMIAQINGSRDGEDWPKAGAIADFPDAEAADLIMNGYAIDPADVEDDEPGDEETADAPDGDVETATPKRGARAKA
ncbi:MAG: hypothetical protein U0R76_10785 [Candidatus Nanopelagicales bacterium]